MRRSASPAERQAAFRERRLWFSRIPVNHENSLKFINEFIRLWGTYGIVTARPGPGDPEFPERFWVQEGANIPPDE
jgi:hypothetical protein